VKHAGRGRSHSKRASPRELLRCKKRTCRIVVDLYPLLAAGCSSWRWVRRGFDGFVVTTAPSRKVPAQTTAPSLPCRFGVGRRPFDLRVLIGQLAHSLISASKDVDTSILLSHAAVMQSSAAAAQDTLVTAYQVLSSLVPTTTCLLLQCQHAWPCADCSLRSESILRCRGVRCDQMETRRLADCC